MTAANIDLHPHRQPRSSSRSAIGAFLSQLPNAVKNEAAYVSGLAGDVYESEPSIGVLELGLRTLRLNRTSAFTPTTNEVLRALARAARERQSIISRLSNKRAPLECYAVEMYDRDPDPHMI